MKKILISILIILLTVLASLAIFKGISIGKIDILSVEDIMDKNDKLNEKIAEAS